MELYVTAGLAVAVLVLAIAVVVVATQVATVAQAVRASSTCEHLRAIQATLRDRLPETVEIRLDHTPAAQWNAATRAKPRRVRTEKQLR